MKAKSVEKPTDMKTASVSARKAQRALFRLLEEHFDEEGGRYASGWSDAEIAKKINLSESAVAAFRNDAFGELAVDPALEAIIARVDAVETRWMIEKRELAEMIKSLDKDSFGHLLILAGAIDEARNEVVHGISPLLVIGA